MMSPSPRRCLTSRHCSTRKTWNRLLRAAVELRHAPRHQRQSHPFHRRRMADLDPAAAVNAAFRIGDPRATALAASATRNEVPESVRVEALEDLGQAGSGPIPVRGSSRGTSPPPAPRAMRHRLGRRPRNRLAELKPSRPPGSRCRSRRSGNTQPEELPEMLATLKAHSNRLSGPPPNGGSPGARRFPSTTWLRVRSRAPSPPARAPSGRWRSARIPQLRKP